MALTVTADLTVNLNVNDSDPSNTVASAGDVIAIAETVVNNFGATPLATVAKSWSYNLTFVASTPQTFDLTALSGPRGSTVTFSSVRLVYIINLATTTGYNLIVGNVASAFLGPLNASTSSDTVPPNSRLLWENNDPSTPWTVDGTHKYLKLDPGSSAFTGRVVIVGS